MVSLTSLVSFVLFALLKMALPSRNGMHAIEDYVLSRYQMYMQVISTQPHIWKYYQNLLKQLLRLYPDNKFLCSNLSTLTTIL